MAYGRFFSTKIDVFWNQKVAATDVAKVRSAYTTLASPPSIKHSNAERPENRTQKMKSKRSANPLSNIKAIGSIAPQLKVGQKNGGLFGERRFLFVFKYKVSGLKFYFQGGGENIFSVCVTRAS